MTGEEFLEQLKAKLANPRYRAQIAWEDKERRRAFLSRGQALDREMEEQYGKDNSSRPRLPFPVRERTSLDRDLTASPRERQLYPRRGASKEPGTGLPKAPPPSSIQLLIDQGSQGTG